MTRDDAFKQVADACRRMADLCDKQKDTIDWWSNFGEQFARFNDAIMEARPLKENHIQAGSKAFHRERK